MNKKEDEELAKMYGEAIEKIEKGETNSIQIKNAEEMFKLIEENKK